MDPLQSLQIKDNTLVVNSENGEICIQLEGSHTTSTETETANFKEKKNVKFEDEKETTEQKRKQETKNTNFGEGKEVMIKIEEYPMATEGNNVTNKEAKQSETELEICAEIEPAERSPLETEATESESCSLNRNLKKLLANSKDLDKLPLEHHKTQNAADENMEIALRFKQIMEEPMATEVNVTKKETKQSETETTAERSPLEAEVAESDSCHLNKDLDKLLLEHHESQYAADENLEISLRLKQIMEMFDNFAKNLETLDVTSSQKPTATSSRTKRKRSKSLLMKREQDLEEPQKHKSRYEEYFKEEQRKEDCQNLQPAIEPRSVSTSASSNELIARNRFEEYLKQQEMEFIAMENDTQKESQETETLKVRTISTATCNFELKTLGCQTVPHDHISLNDLSLMEVSSLTSTTEQPNSLNNYAQPENACTTPYSRQQDNDKKPLIDNKNQHPPLIPPIVNQESSNAPAFNIITIEANATPSATELRRAPLCQRLWSVICDFCAATFLCLQVNRDCIFCLGFFAAFVVSASFLTAFFYHTLSVSPSLWQTPDNMRL